MNQKNRALQQNIFHLETALNLGAVKGTLLKRQLADCEFRFSNFEPRAINRNPQTNVSIAELLVTTRERDLYCLLELDDPSLICFQKRTLAGWFLELVQDTPEVKEVADKFGCILFHWHHYCLWRTSNWLCLSYFYLFLFLILYCLSFSRSHKKAHFLRCWRRLFSFKLIHFYLPRTFILLPMCRENLYIFNRLQIIFHLCLRWPWATLLDTMVPLSLKMAHVELLCTVSKSQFFLLECFANEPYFSIRSPAFKLCMTHL